MNPVVVEQEVCHLLLHLLSELVLQPGLGGLYARVPSDLFPSTGKHGHRVPLGTSRAQYCREPCQSTNTGSQCLSAFLSAAPYQKAEKVSNGGWPDSRAC